MRINGVTMATTVIVVNTLQCKGVIEEKYQKRGPDNASGPLSHCGCNHKAKREGYSVNQVWS